MSCPNNDRIDIAERELKHWLTRYAETGLPELILVGLLYEYADRIERYGYIPRTWKAAVRSDNVSPTTIQKP